MKTERIFSCAIFVMFDGHDNCQEDAKPTNLFIFHKPLHLLLVALHTWMTINLTIFIPGDPKKCSRLTNYKTVAFCSTV